MPIQLRGTVILELDLGSLAAGCMMPGEFEERLKAVIDEIAGARNKIILFIDDIHNLVPNLMQQGASMMDGGSILKPALSRCEPVAYPGSSLCPRAVAFTSFALINARASCVRYEMCELFICRASARRGELKCIGVTTIDKYKKTIEKDPALERRFQQINVGQPSVEDTVSILRGLRPRWGDGHCMLPGCDVG